MVAHVDLRWARVELIPFLNTVFPAKSDMKWENIIVHAANAIEEIPFYEDFPYTIERLRLSLINPSELTEAEGTQFAKFRNNPQLSVQIFVRHAIRQEAWYPLFSLGHARSRDFPSPPASVMEKRDGSQVEYATLLDELEARKKHGGGLEWANQDGTGRSNSEAYNNRPTITDGGGSRSDGISVGIKYFADATNGGYAMDGEDGWGCNHDPGVVDPVRRMVQPGRLDHKSSQSFEHHCSVASSHDEGVVFKDGAGFYPLRGEAKEFLPGAAAHGRWSE